MIRISAAAAEKLRALPRAEQQKLREMLEEIAAVAAALVPAGARWWLPAASRHLLQLRCGRTTVRYALHADARTLAVEHVIDGRL